MRIARTACLLAALASSTWSIPAAGQTSEGSIRASCTDKGRIVYREDLPPGVPANRRLEIAASYPNALCIFLKASAAPPSGEDNLAAILPGGADTPTEDLANALSYLSTGDEVGKPYGEDFDEGMQTFMKSANAFSQPAKTVNLTIGVYEDTTSAEVLEHWAFIEKNTKRLGKMTPSIQRLDDITVLNVEDVLDSDAAEVCAEAEKVASGCVAVY